MLIDVSGGRRGASWLVASHTNLALVGRRLQYCSTVDEQDTTATSELYTHYMITSSACNRLCHHVL